MASVDETHPTLQDVLNNINAFGYAQLLGMHIEHAGDGKGTVRIKVDSRLMHPQQIVHGGVIFTLADTAMSMAMISLLPVGTRFSTVEAKINYLAPVRAGEIVAEATVLQQGRVISVVESSVYNVEGEERRLIGRVLGTFHAASTRYNPIVNDGKDEKSA